MQRPVIPNETENETLTPSNTTTRIDGGAVIRRPGRPAASAGEFVLDIGGRHVAEEGDFAIVRVGVVGQVGHARAGHGLVIEVPVLVVVAAVRDGGQVGNFADGDVVDARGGGFVVK